MDLDDAGTDKDFWVGAEKKREHRFFTEGILHMIHDVIGLLTLPI